MDTDHTSVPGEEFLDLPLERPSDGELDLDGSFLDQEDEETGVVPSLDGVLAEPDDSSAPVLDGLLELTDDVWGPDAGEAAPEIDEELADGLAIEPAPEDEDAEPIFGLAAFSEAPWDRPAPRRGAREMWAGMAPSRRRAIGVAGSAFVAVALVGAAWLQRPDGSENVISTGTVQTTTSVRARSTTPPPASTALRATDTSVTVAPDASVAPAGTEPGSTSSPPAVPGGPPSPRVTAAGAGPAAPSAPVTAAPTQGGTTPATRAVETTAPPTTPPPATIAPPDTTETTRRLREPPTTVTTAPPTPPTAPTTETTLPCSEFVKRGPLACPPAE